MMIAQSTVSEKSIKFLFAAENENFCDFLGIFFLFLGKFSKEVLFVKTRKRVASEYVEEQMIHNLVFIWNFYLYWFSLV